MRKGLSLRRHPVYRLFLWVALAASLALLWRMNALVLSNPKYIPVDDFSHYWAAGRLNTTGGNPYDPQQVQQQDILYLLVLHSIYDKTGDV